MAALEVQGCRYVQQLLYWMEITETRWHRSEGQGIEGSQYCFLLKSLLKSTCKLSGLYSSFVH